MGHKGVGWIIQGLGGSYSKGVVHTGVRGSSRGRVGNAGVDGSCWVAVVWGWGGYVGVGWGGSCRVGSGGSSRGGAKWVIQRWDGVGHEKYRKY